ncbi:MAG: hydroxyacylglutathione hydrolase [Bdellovibrionaceae bacterium]|nr:hydroxyacylglutathione hydrolase [Pseudobdellovibrionaceae bacterium]
MKQYYIKEYSDSHHTKVIIIPIFDDNYVYILTDETRKAFIVDPGQAESVIGVIEELKLQPTHLLITHSHQDHVGGVKKIKSRYPSMALFDYRNCINETNFFQWNDRSFTVFKTPGHWPDHICFFEERNKILFCGDILFRFGCGRIFDGTFEELYSSLQKIKMLPPDTDVFCTHEYTRQNLAFCMSQQLVNRDDFSEQERILIESTPSLPVKLETELRFNPFLKVATLEGLKKLRILRNEFKS